MNIVYAAHSGIRFLVLLMAAVVIIHAVVQLARKRPYTDASGRFLKVYTGVLDLQLLLGIVLLFLRPFYGALIGHIVLMVLAVATAHITSKKLGRMEPEARGHGRQLAGVAISLALILAGILAIGRGILTSTV